MFVDENVINFFENEMVLAKIDTEKDSVLKDEYQVKGLPTIVLLDTTGEEIDRIVGYHPPDEFIRILREYRQGIGTLDDLLEPLVVLIAETQLPDAP